MKPLTYRTRRRLQRIGTFLGYLAVFTVVIGLCWIVWLERFVVYGSNGARIDFDYRSPDGQAQLAVPPDDSTVAIYYNEGDAYVDTSSDLTQISGCLITEQMLSADIDQLRSAISAEENSGVIMLDLKSIYGKFFYTSTLPGAPVSGAIDTAKVDALIRTLDQSGAYLIARMPAFRDQAYALENNTHGLAHKSGLYLWADESNCYWLNPTNTGVLTWLISVANELKDLGFDEVVFSEFQFPDTENIIFNSSMTRQEALESAAQTLVTACATNRFAVSFETGNAGFALPEGRSRLYLTGVDAANAADTAASAPVADSTVNLVFVTEAKDTRFDAYGVIRPLTFSAQ